MESLNERIKNLRKEKGWTQLQLAEKLSVTDKAVSKWEVGESNPDIILLPKLAELFGVTLDYLLTGKKEERISLDDMDSSKRLYYLIKRDDVDNFVKYRYDAMSRQNALFTQTIKFGKYDFKMVNIDIWKQLLSENANNIISLAFDKLLAEHNNGVCLAFLFREIYDDLIKKVVDLDRSDVLDRLGIMHTKVGEPSDLDIRNNITSKSTFELPLILKGNLDELFRFNPMIIKKSTLNYILENEKKSPRCYAYVTNINIKIKKITTFKIEETVYLYNTLEEDILKYAIAHRNIELIKSYHELFVSELNSLTKPDERNGCFYYLFKDYVRTSYEVVARMHFWSMDAINCAIKSNDIELASSMVELNKLYIKKYNEIWHRDPKDMPYIIPIGEIERQVALLNDNLSMSDRFMLKCIKDSCIDSMVLKSSRDLKLVRKILDEYAYCPYEFIYKCLTENKQKDLFKYFLDHDDSSNAMMMLAGEINYQKILLNSLDKYKSSDVVNAVVASNNIRDKIEINKNRSIYKMCEKLNLLETNPMIIEIKKIKEQIYQYVVDAIATEKKAEEERIEKEKIVKGLTKEYFEELLSSGATELFYIKLCSLLDAIYKFDYHYEGEDFSARMNMHFRKLEESIPKSRNCDDGWGYMVLDAEYENNVVVPEKNKIEHLKDVFNRLRIQRNNIAHSTQQPVKELTNAEMKECLEYVFKIN